MERNAKGRFQKTPEPPVNQAWLSIGKTRQDNELRILRDRYDLAVQSQPFGMSGQPDPMHAQRLKAAEDIASQIEAVEALSDREVVDKYVPEANQPEPVTPAEGLARGAMVEMMDPAQYGWGINGTYAPGDFNLAAR